MPDRVVLKVAEAPQSDVGLVRARTDAKTRLALGVDVGEIIEIIGKKSTPAKLFRVVQVEDEGKGIIRIDGLVRRNLGVSIGDDVEVRKAEVSQARHMTIAPIIGEGHRISFGPGIENFVRRGLQKRPLITGDVVLVPGIALMGGALPFMVTETAPNGIVQINEYTIIEMKEEPAHAGENLRFGAISQGPAERPSEEPKVEEVFLMTSGGVLIAREGPLPPRMDPDLVAGQLWAVYLFVEDAFRGKKLAKLNFGDSVIVIERGEFVTLVAVILGETTQALHGALSRCVHDIEERYGEAIENWPGTDVLGRLFAPRLNHLLGKGFLRVPGTEGATRTDATPERAPDQPSRMKIKVAMVGDVGTGKTELIRRHVFDEFDDRYITTLGAKVSKKEVVVENPKGDRKIAIDMTIWDVLGEKGFRELLAEAYFHGTKVILAVCDGSRKETLDSLDDWIDSARRAAGNVPVVLAVNTKNYPAGSILDIRTVEGVANSYDAPFLYASGKTGENVKELFQKVGELAVRQWLSHGGRPSPQKD